VNYLSGGLSLDRATDILAAINELKRERGGDKYAPWNLSFSWSSCIQLPLFELCRSEQKDESGLPRAAIQTLYLNNLWRARAAAQGGL
jgi:fructose-bisphosphate aldolase class 1